MDVFILLLLEKYGGTAILFGVVLYLTVEGFLDVATDILSHKIIKRIEKEPD